MAPLSRRELLASLGGVALAGLPREEALAASSEFEVRDLRVPGDRELGRRFTLLIPRHLARGERVRLLVLLHGRAETVDERLGVYAWLERYGLGSAYTRLLRPPIARTMARPDWTASRLAEVNAALASRPFRGLAVVCPYTPSPRALRRPAGLEAYARWIAEVVIPRARGEAPVLAAASETAIDGCSLGGWLALEVFLHRPRLFGAWGGVQAALGVGRAEHYASRLARALAEAGSRELHLLSSQGDPFLAANRALSGALRRRGVGCRLRVLPGPHDQAWLREAGTLELLLWHERRG